MSSCCRISGETEAQTGSGSPGRRCSPCPPHGEQKVTWLEDSEPPPARSCCAAVVAHTDKVPSGQILSLRSVPSASPLGFDRRDWAPAPFEPPPAGSSPGGGCLCLSRVSNQSDGGTLSTDGARGCTGQLAPFASPLLEAPSFFQDLGQVCSCLEVQPSLRTGVDWRASSLQGPPRAPRMIRTVLRGHPPATPMASGTFTWSLVTFNGKSFARSLRGGCSSRSGTQISPRCLAVPRRVWEGR